MLFLLYFERSNGISFAVTGKFQQMALYGPFIAIVANIYIVYYKLLLVVSELLYSLT